MIEKKPNATAEIAEKPKANRFLYFIWRKTDTIDSKVTAKSMSPNTIFIHPFNFPQHYLLL